MRFPLGSSPLVAVDSNTEQQTKQSEMPPEQRNRDPPSHRLICITGAELLQPQRCAPNLLVQYRQTRHQNYAGSAHFHFHRRSMTSHCPLQLPSFPLSQLCYIKVFLLLFSVEMLFWLQFIPTKLNLHGYCNALARDVLKYHFFLYCKTFL